MGAQICPRPGLTCPAQCQSQAGSSLAERLRSLQPVWLHAGVCCGCALVGCSAGPIQHTACQILACTRGMNPNPSALCPASAPRISVAPRVPPLVLSNDLTQVIPPCLDDPTCQGTGSEPRSTTPGPVDTAPTRYFIQTGHSSSTSLDSRPHPASTKANMGFASIAGPGWGGGGIPLGALGSGPGGQGSHGRQAGRPGGAGLAAVPAGNLRAAAQPRG